MWWLWHTTTRRTYRFAKYILFPIAYYRKCIENSLYLWIRSGIWTQLSKVHFSYEVHTILLSTKYNHILENCEVHCPPLTLSSKKHTLNLLCQNVAMIP
jgi:hypothetical protein